eukprot:3865026-Rhodomonas_salina.1
MSPSLPFSLLALLPPSLATKAESDVAPDMSRAGAGLGGRAGHPRALFPPRRHLQGSKPPQPRHHLIVVIITIITITTTIVIFIVLLLISWLSEEGPRPPHSLGQKRS